MSSGRNVRTRILLGFCLVLVDWSPARLRTRLLFRRQLPQELKNDTEQLKNTPLSSFCCYNYAAVVHPHPYHSSVTRFTVTLSLRHSLQQNLMSFTRKKLNETLYLITEFRLAFLDRRGPLKKNYNVHIVTFFS
jgi:hypothetical protein